MGESFGKRTAETIMINELCVFITLSNQSGKELLVLYIRYTLNTDFAQCSSDSVAWDSVCSREQRL